jgi:hypothetical protein
MWPNSVILKKLHTQDFRNLERISVARHDAILQKRRRGLPLSRCVYGRGNAP